MGYMQLSVEIAMMNVELSFCVERVVVLENPQIACHVEHVQDLVLFSTNVLVAMDSAQ